MKLENLIDSMGNRRLSKNPEEGFLFNKHNQEFSEKEEENSTRNNELPPDDNSTVQEAFDINRSSLTSSQPQSILKNTATGPSLKMINTSRSSPIQPSNKKKVYFQIEAKKDPLFLKNLKLQ